MKVAVLIDTWFPFIGGGQVNAIEISKRIAKSGVKVEIVTRNNGKDKLKYGKNIRVVKLGKKSKYDDNFSKIIYLIRAYFYVLNKKFDLVHAHAFLPGITAKLLMTTKKVPAIYSVHGTSIGTNLTSQFSLISEKFILTKLKYSAQITVSRDFLKIKNVNENIEYIPNGVNEIFLQKKLFRKSNTILCVARLHPQKNLINLIKAFKAISVDFPNYNLIIAGSGPQKDELSSLIKDLKLKKKVKLIGEVDKKSLKRLYGLSKLFVLPSIYEGQPISMLEAMAASLPVVVSRVGDNPYIIKDTINGYLINKPLNEINITKALSKALVQKNLELVGKNGKQSIIDFFSWNTAANKTLDVYEKII